MRVKINRHAEIVVDAVHMFELALTTADDETRDGVVQAISCVDGVVRHVADQIFHGCTDNGSHAYMGTSAESPSTDLDAARARLADFAEPATQERVRRMESQLSEQRGLAQKYQRWAFEMYHAWPDGHRGSRPEIDRFGFSDAATQARDELVEFVKEAAHGGCHCSQPPMGECTCLSCKARALLAKHQPEQEVEK